MLLPAAVWKNVFAIIVGFDFVKLFTRLCKHPVSKGIGRKIGKYMESMQTSKDLLCKKWFWHCSIMICCYK